MAIVPAVCPLSGQTMLDLNGAPMRGAMIYAYQAETTTPRTVFKDYACQTPHPNPIPVNAYGNIPQIYVDVGDYKIVRKGPDGVLIDSFDHFPGGQQAASTTSTASGFTTGDVKYAVLPIPQNGWVIANGTTIGSGTSAATGRANDDTQLLYVALWNAMPQLVVTPARGLSATLDFQAGKTLALPDFRARVAAGVDKMGAPTAAGRLTAISTGAPDQIGTVFGSESTVLSVAQLPTFTPSVTMAPAGGHTHTGTAASAGAHSHGGTTDAQGAHNHTYRASQENNIQGTGGANSPNSGGFAGTTSTTPAHSHNITTDTQGAHTHTLAVDAVADHTHTLTAGAIGSSNAHSNSQPTILVYVHIRL